MARLNSLVTEYAMGQSPSSPSALGMPAAPSRRSRASSLPSTGRYFVLQAANGVKVHVLGVYPCSTISEEETADLVVSVQPQVVYVDVHPELLATLEAEVAAGRFGRGFMPSETPCRYRKFPGAGWIASVKVRQWMADNEVFALLGAEMFGPFKAAIAAARTIPTAPQLIPFPISMSYNNGENMDRPNHIVASLVGNNSMSSTTLFATLGNQIKMLSFASGDVTFAAELPPGTGYFTRAQALKLQERFRTAVNSVVMSATAASMDVEAEAEALEDKARTSEDPLTASALHDYSIRAQNQTQAIVYALHDAAAKLPPNGNVVAVVNLGAVASLTRNWSSGRPVEELFPPLSPVTQAAVYAVQSAVLGGVGYGLYRVGRRFPKTTVGATALLATGVGLTAYGLIYAETMMYGGIVRAALARPTVSSSVARINSK